MELAEISEPLSTPDEKTGRHSAKILRLLGSFATGRTDHGLTPEEIAIFLAIGSLSLVHLGRIAALKPVTYQEISTMLHIPKATVRRKAIRLIDKKLVAATSRGVMLQDFVAWQRLVENIFE